MLYDVKTPEEYMEALDKDWRYDKLQMVRSIIKTKAPDIVEGIEYKMLSYGDGTNGLFYLNAQKNYVSLYVGTIKKVDPDGALLKGMDLGKGCIRIKKSIKIDETGLEEFIERAIDYWKNGIDVGC